MLLHNQHIPHKPHSNGSGAGQKIKIYNQIFIYKESKLHSQSTLLLGLLLYGQLRATKLGVSALNQRLRSTNGVVQISLVQGHSGCGWPQHQSWSSTTHIRHCSVGSNHKSLRQQLSNGICLTEDVQQSTDPLWLWPRRKKSLVQANKRRPA